MVDSVEEIKNRLDLVEVVKDYIKLKKAGANYQAVCPFHSEKKPSFFVSPSKQIWKCFGCGKAGDMFAFVQEIEGADFPEALRILARKAGVELERISPEIRGKKNELYEICELAVKFFQKQLESSTGQKAKEYLLNDRKISKDSIKKWRLGYAPDTRKGLINFLTSRGYDRGEIQRVGLTIKSREGELCDRFRGRIMFPIFDLHSQAIGFGGRIFENEKDESEKEGLAKAKYINTPNTPLYDKSRILYGLDKSRVVIRKGSACILVEGYIDVILSHQAGIENIVATSGTALTPYQLNILKRYSDNLLLAFDMDIAGDTATKRGIDLAQRKGFNIKVLLMPQEHDPADIISQEPEQWKEIINKARDILEFYFETTLNKFDKTTLEGKKGISKTLLPVIKRIPNEIVRFHWIQRLANELKVKEESIEKELNKVRIETRESGKDEEAVRQEPSKDRQEILEDQLLFLILQDPENIKALEDKDIELLSPDTVQLLSVLKSYNLDFDILKRELTPELFQKIKLVSLEVEVREKIEGIEKEIHECLKQIKSFRLKRELGRISRLLEEAEEKGNRGRVAKLTEEFNTLSKQLNQ